MQLPPSFWRIKQQEDFPETSHFLCRFSLIFTLVPNPAQLKCSPSPKQGLWALAGDFSPLPFLLWAGQTQLPQPLPVHTATEMVRGWHGAPSASSSLSVGQVANFTWQPLILCSKAYSWFQNWHSDLGEAKTHHFYTIAPVARTGYLKNTYILLWAPT